MKCSCDANATSSPFLITAGHFLRRRPAEWNCWGDKPGVQRKGGWGTGRRKVYPDCVGSGKCHHCKPFLTSESHSEDSALLGGEEKGEGAGSKWLCLFPSTEGAWSKASALTLRRLLPPPHGAVTVSVSWILLYPCPHSQTFCPMLKSDMLNSILVIICFQCKWKTNSLNVLELNYPILSSLRF